MKHRFHRLIALALIAAPALGIARADGPSNEGITVVGSAEVKAKPTVVEIEATVSGEAELTNDAMVKYRDARKRAIAAIEGLKMPNLTLGYNGVSITQAIDPNAAQMMMQGRAPAAGAKPKVQASEALRITLKDADKLPTDQLLDTLMKVIDTGRDAGLQVGANMPTNYYQYQMAMQNGQSAGGGLLQFKITDPTGQRAKAYKGAMDDAKAKAQRLADLAGIKLGRIVSVRDTGVAPMSANPNAQSENGASQPESAGELSSAMLTEIPLKVTLTVQFEIAK